MTLNEERNIDYCLRSVRPWCDEVIVVDMKSDDRTTEIAARHADAIVAHERIAAFDAAREAGLKRATGDWILSIDADEVATPELAAWLREFADSDPPYDLALIPRVNVFLGQRITSTRWWPGKRRFFRPTAIRVTAQLHRGLVVKPGVRVKRLPKDSNLSIWQFSNVSLTALNDKLNRYTTLEAQQARAAGRREPRRLELVGAPLRQLVKYVARGVHRDGIAGLAYLANRMYYAFMAAAKRWDEPRAGRRQDEYDDMREAILGRFAGSTAADGGAPTDRG
jgi:glycosyltransferase involved in cell wall biosynthesis